MVSVASTCHVGALVESPRASGRAHHGRHAASEVTNLGVTRSVALDGVTRASIRSRWNIAGNANPVSSSMLVVVVVDPCGAG